MREDVIEIRHRREILLIGWPGSLHRLPSEVRRRGSAAALVRHLTHEPQEVARLRAFWTAHALAPLTGRVTDQAFLARVGEAIDHGRLEAAVIRDVRPDTATLPKGAATPPWRTAAPRLSSALKAQGPGMVTRVAATAAVAAPGMVMAGTIAAAVLTRPSMPVRPVSQWTMRERMETVFAKLKESHRLTGALKTQLLEMLTPENIAVAVIVAEITADLVALANTTPYGWAADAVVVGVLFATGGLAAIYAALDLVSCFKLTVTARSEADLDEAADDLAKFLVALGVTILMWLLHVAANKWGPQGRAATEDSRPQPQSAAKQVAPTPPTQSPPPASSIKPEPPALVPMRKTISQERAAHVLDGDKSGGGHRCGTGKPGKSEFPKHWTDDKILNAIDEVAQNGSVAGPAHRPGEIVKAMTIDGVDIEVVVKADGTIRTAYPTGGAGVIRNPR